jgi:hypothetical protein
VGLGLVILILFEVRERRRAGKERRLYDSATASNTENREPSNNRSRLAEIRTEDREPRTECCGQHLVCERETLLQTRAEIEYYDDEELDILAGRDANDYTGEEADLIREVFRTLQEADVTGWVRSMQLRGIQLPADVREEALLIVRERRNR